MINQYLFCLLAFVLVTNAFGCNCYSHHPKSFSLQEKYELAPLVVEAKVISQNLAVHRSLDHGTEPAKEYEFELLQTLKGCPPGEKFSGKSLILADMCGVDLKAGESYVLFLRDTSVPHHRSDYDGFHLNKCQFNLPSESLDDAELSYMQAMSSVPGNVCI